MARISAGILLFKRVPQLQVLLVHPGGPFWQRKDEGAWTIPKGEVNEGEALLETAIREFAEETGTSLQGEFIELGYIVQKGGKQVHAWACESDLDTSAIVSNTFELEWPPRSGKMKSFPEVDKAEWFDIDVALVKINDKQQELIVRLQSMV
jgi:predicted NUDIX family NTP pyrophosphohydrolase